MVDYGDTVHCHRCRVSFPADPLKQICGLRETRTNLCPSCLRQYEELKERIKKYYEYQLRSIILQSFVDKV